MAGPWEKYAAQSAPVAQEAAPAAVATQPAGPWSKYAAPAAQEAAPAERSLSDKFWNDTITGSVLKSVGSAISLPGDVLEGKVDPLSDEAIRRGVDFAGVASPIGAASRAAQGVAAAAVPQVMRMAEPGTGQAVREAGERLGVALPRAVTSDRTSVQQAGKLVANVPIGGAPIRRAASKAIDDLGTAAKTTQEAFGSGSPAIAGDAAREGIKTYSDDVLGGQVTQRYNAVDNMVKGDVTAPLEATRSASAAITARRQNAGIGQPSDAVKRISDALERPEGLNYTGTKDLRTYIGELLKTPSLIPADTSQSELKQIYASLSSDLRGVVDKAGGPNAVKAFEEANTFAAKVAGERESLNRFLQTKNDEGLFDRIVATAGSTSRADLKQLARARGAVSPETWDEMSSAVIARLGRGPDGEFSPDRFVTGYSKLTEGGKTVLFKSTGRENLAQSLDDIAEVSKRFKSLNQFANPSGTGQTVMGGALGTGLLTEPITALSSVLGARILSTVLAKPASAKAAANWSKAYEMSVTKPSRGTAQLLRNRSQALAATITADSGLPDQAGRIAAGLNGVVRGEPQDDEQQIRPVRPEQ